MPVQSIKNQYPGINAHLHSFWQATRTWNRFHNLFISFLDVTLRKQLRPLGYTAIMEESLQIRRASGELILSPQPDVVIYDPQRRSPTSERLIPGHEIATVAELLGIVETEHPYFAIILRPLRADLLQSEAVVWIELLSPTNKGRSSDAWTYVDKRRALVESGLVFVEIDFLHETPSTITKIPDYTLNQPNASPYHIIVLDPRPSIEVGPAERYEFSVNAPIPTVIIPLNGDDFLAFDFNAVYQRVFEEATFGDDIDYAQFPMNFNRYSRTDQERIANLMLVVIRAAQTGVDLEADTPLPIHEPLLLEEALTQIKLLTSEQA